MSSFSILRMRTNAQVACLSIFVERNLDCKDQMYTRYNDFLKALDSHGRVREMIKQHESAQQRMTWATNMLGDLWQQFRELQEILGDSNRSEKWLRLPAIANQSARDPEFPKRCLDRAYVKRFRKPHRKPKANKWYTSGDF